MRGIQAAMAGWLVCAGLSASAYAAEIAGKVEGTWSLNNWIPGDTVHLKMKHHTTTTHWEWGTDQPLADLHGLTLDQLHAAHTPVTFTIQRDAGTFGCEGSLVVGVGGGTFRFTPDLSFAAKLAALGFDPVATNDLFAMALRDVSLAFAEAVRGAGLVGVSAHDLLRFRDHEIGPELFRDLASLGYTGLTADDVVRFQEHGIGGDYLRGLKSSGDPPFAANDIVRLHDHGIDSAYVARIQASGFGTLTVEQIVKLHDHGVD